MSGKGQEVSMPEVCLYNFRDGLCVGFDFMLRCFLRFRVVDDCFPLVLCELGCVCVCLYS
jgi:hypothetical protein